MGLVQRDLKEDVLQYIAIFMLRNKCHRSVYTTTQETAIVGFSLYHDLYLEKWIGLRTL
jgi:hypothetical protein